ncbi:MAG: hypothetical protein AAF639_13445, partial [Chloroflexota bacterium]
GNPPLSCSEILVRTTNPDPWPAELRKLLWQILLSLGIEPAGVASFLDELPAALQGNADGVELLMDVGEGISLTPPCGSTASVA